MYSDVSWEQPVWFFCNRGGFESNIKHLLYHVHLYTLECFDNENMERVCMHVENYKLYIHFLDPDGINSNGMEAKNGVQWSHFLLNFRIFNK